MRLGCVLMASGEGRRFGENKLLKRFGGQTLVARALALAPGDWRRVAVAREDAVAHLCRIAGFETVMNGFPDLCDTIRLGVERMDGVDGCLFLVCDQPLLQRQTLCRMADAFARAPSSIVRLSADGRAGSPVLFPRDCFAELAKLAPGESGAKVIRANRERVLLVEAASPLELEDVDTPEALARLERVFNEEEAYVYPQTTADGRHGAGDHGV